MADIAEGIAESVRKAFLAGVGAVAFGAEKSGELIDELVKKGEVTVDQGKDLNRELTRKTKEVVDGAQESVLRTRLSAMSPEERARFIDQAQQLASDLNAQDAQSSAAHHQASEHSQATKVPVETDATHDTDAHMSKE